MLPVYLSLFGLKLDPETKLFIGWFGPRGLASIVFMVIVLDEKLAGADVLLATVTTTIVLSVILHGITANPWRAGWVRELTLASWFDLGNRSGRRLP